MFDIPVDFLKFNQSEEKPTALLKNIVTKVSVEDDDFDVFYESDWNLPALAQAGSGVTVVREAAMLFQKTHSRNDLVLTAAAVED